MALDYAEILARKAKRRQEDEEDDRILSENAVAAAEELKSSLESIAKSTGKDVLTLLGYGRETVMKWANSQKTPIFENDDEKAEFNKFKASNLGEFPYLDENNVRQVAKLSKIGTPKRSFIVAWRKDKKIKPIK